jgi:hypothetical protein
MKKKGAFLHFVISVSRMSTKMIFLLKIRGGKCKTSWDFHVLKLKSTFNKKRQNEKTKDEKGEKNEKILEILQKFVT